ncbi:MAG: hypothetical protein HZB62_02705 [Nitrospirae bacterium]|nr:hypothetical protein [Nitrospirota bacterium]
MDEKDMGKVFCKNTAAIICLLIALLCSGGSSGGAVQEADLFEKAYEYYLALNPEKSIETFDQFLKQFPDSSALDSVLFWRAKALMQMKRIDEAARGLRKLRETFPESSYSIFAEKELDALKNLPQRTDRTDIVREKTAKISDAKIEGYENRIRKLEAEKADLEKQLSDAERKRQLTEKGLSKALDDKNALESQLDEVKKSRDDLVQKGAVLEKGSTETSRLAEEKRVLESRLKAGEEKIGKLSADLKRTEEKIAAISGELTGKIQQGQKDWEQLDLLSKELKTRNMAIETSLKEKDSALSDAQQSMASMKKSMADFQSAKQRDVESLNQSVARLSAEKVLLAEEAAAEKKKADDLLARLQAKDGEVKKLLSDETKRKASESAAEERLKHGVAELARMQGERDDLQSSVRTLEARLREKNDLASQAGDIKKLREEVISSTAELDRIKKENRALLEDRKVLETRIAEDQEKSRLSALSRDKEEEKEKKALVAESRELERKLHDAAAQVRQLLDDRQKMDAVLKDRDQGLARSQEAIALLERTLKGAEQEKAKQIQELVERSRTADIEKKTLQDELARERKRVAEFSGRVTEREAALIDEVKALQGSRQELEARLASEKGDRRDEKLKLEAERDSIRRQFEELGAQATKVRDVLSQLDESRKKQEELAKIAALNDKEITKLRTEKGELESRLKDAVKRQDETDLALIRISEEKQVREAQLKDQQNRLTKSQESITLLEKTLKGSEQEKARQLQDLDMRAIKTRDALSQLEESLKKQEELVKIAALNDKEITRLRAEKAGLEDKLRVVEEGVKTLSGIKQRDERTAAEKLDLEQKLTKERARFDTETQKIGSERDELKKQLGGLEALRKEKEGLAARLDETKRLHADAIMKSGQAEKMAQDNQILLDEKKQLEIRLRDSEEKIAVLASQRDKDTALERERKDLAARLDEQERKLKEQQASISRLMVEKGAMEKELKEGRQDIAAVKALRESRDHLQREADRMKTEQKQMQAELSELKKIDKEHLTANKALSGELAALRMQARDTDKPFLRIGQERFTLATVIREGTIAGSVADKIRVKTVPWRTGNIVDDFIAEQILARRAREEAFTIDPKLKGSLVKQYALNEEEGAYLDRYLAIDGLFRSKDAIPAPTETDAREYYNKHREQYLHGRESRIRVLSIKYGKSDELEKSVIAVEIHGEALEGRPFDAIARKRPAVASMKEMSLSKLPEWVRVRLASLREGEISSIISTDNEFMIIQALPSKPGYRPFEEVKKEVEKKLSAEHSGRRQSLEDWLNAQKKEIEFLR